MGAAACAAAVRALGVAVAAALLACRCAAQPSGSGCMPELVGLSPCMDYLSGNATTPDAPSCCSALSSMLRSSPGCLCTVLGGTAASLGVAVDGARVAQLPGACKVQAPPATQCNAVGAPVASPAAPSDANATPAGSGSKSTPASTLPYSDGNTGKPGRIFVFAAAALALLHRL
ncbi:non-specific lipid transfer protein GPI-anchored 15-like [Panicum virgatum]|uniref:Bifunctional inhibitor/plant lipid transfer protein/seed storage helical domain-containing protein n=1 Tax=Panicum virgatum TaxID=38727 RepID=A0A8T0MCW4_PANVG|nr:non-specific lipid transfer protein GPI-anchored 15-like [Panicum virgatum]KAG2534635.1 hypothetical protein PVAP13_9NG073147 [Panicum virgatum]